MQITEAIITREALLFLKGHYKLRPRTTPTETEMNLRGEGGVIIDGYLAYGTEEGPFTATVEATDFFRRDELRFRPLPGLLFWDVLALSLITLASGLVLAHIRDWLALYLLGIWRTALWLLISLLLTGLAFLGLLYRWRRYRYIYAIEQFKSYHADEQWVAFSADVFPPFDNGYFRELKNQCIYNGVGLLEVGGDRRIKVLMTPARRGGLGAPRRLLRFFRNPMTGITRPDVLKGAPIPARARRALLKESALASDLLRFRPRYYTQLSLSLAAMLITGMVVREEWKDAPIEKVSPKAYREAQTELFAELSQTGGEALYFLVDTNFLPPPWNDVQPYLAISTLNTPSRRDGDHVWQVVDNRILAFDCSRLYNFAGPMYLVFVKSFFDPALARTVMLESRQAGLRVNVMWAGCFFPGKDFYILYLEELYPTLEEAQLAESRVKNDRRRYQTLGLSSGISRVFPQ